MTDTRVYFRAVYRVERVGTDYRWVWVITLPYEFQGEEKQRIATVAFGLILFKKKRLREGVFYKLFNL